MQTKYEQILTDKAQEMDEKMAARETLINQKIDDNIQYIELTTSYSTLITRASVSIISKDFFGALLESINALAGSIPLYTHESKINHKNPTHILEQSTETTKIYIKHIDSNDINLKTVNTTIADLLDKTIEHIGQCVTDEESIIPKLHQTQILEILTLVKTMREKPQS